MAQLMVLQTDLAIDLQFGKWIKREREIAGLTALQVYRRTGIKPHRLYEIEWGIAERSITTREAKILSELYEVSLKDVTRRACGEPTELEEM